LGGAVFVAALAILPDILHRVMNTPFYFGGTSILIVVGVALDTVGSWSPTSSCGITKGSPKRGGSKAVGLMSVREASPKEKHHEYCSAGRTGVGKRHAGSAVVSSIQNAAHFDGRYFS
jgi:hypothetical protein